MARKPTGAGRSSANLTPDAKRQAIPRLQARVEELRQLDVSTISNGRDEKIESIAARVIATLSDIYGPDTLEFARLRDAGHLDATSYVLSLSPGRSRTPAGDIQAGVDRGRKRAMALLQGEIDSLSESVQHAGGRPTEEPAEEGLAQEASDEIFIVHGHDGPAKVEVTLFLERAGLKPIVLHEKANAGDTVIEKFEAHAGTARFAVILLTPDDVGGPDVDHLEPRARQNVIGEMFWFAGRLGRKRICALKKGEIEVPSDFVGVIYTQMDDRGAWKGELLRELEAAGYTVNWSKAMA